MPQFFLDLQNGNGFNEDEVGADFPDQSAAKVAAIDSIRAIVAEEIRSGTMDMRGYIDIRDSANHHLLRVSFVEAIDVIMPS